MENRATLINSMRHRQSSSLHFHFYLQTQIYASNIRSLADQTHTLNLNNSFPAATEKIDSL